MAKPIIAKPRRYLRSFPAGFFAVLCCALTVPRTACAGVSPENVIVVVNSESSVSRTIANHYVELRDIPDANVIFLENVPSEPLVISLDDFKKKILLPILTQINQRGLAAQARVIAYSAGFPTSVNIKAHADKLSDEDQIKYQKPTASINGLTYFYRFVLGDHPGYLGWYSNLYARGPFERHFVNPFGGEARERFAKASADAGDGQHESAAKEFERLFDDHPTLAPLAILASESYAKADQADAAKKILKRGILAGWWSGTYLRDSAELAPLLSDPNITPLLERLDDYPANVQAPVGFTGTGGWTGCGHPVPQVDQAAAYLMSCVLAVVHPRGSTPEQAIEVLRRASDADHSRPSGKVWFTRTKDIRTTTRFVDIGDAMLWLNHLNRPAEIIHAAMPAKRDACVGLMLGTAKMPLTGKTWTFAPGAIADNLTSLSGHFGDSSQTKLTELLHAGAAMTCGPVYEPYSIAYKFPQPIMHGFYASGVSAIEAFYLSIRSPYQQLIVGDPLSQPFARPPTDWASIKLETTPDKQISVTRTPVRFQAPATTPSTVELFINGKLVRVAPAARRINLTIAETSSGVTEVRAVIVGLDATQPRAWFGEWLDLDGPFSTPIAKHQNASPKVPLASASIELEAAGADSIELRHHLESVATIDGEKGSCEVRSRKLGSGPVRLTPYARYGDQIITGKPIVVELIDPATQ